jgi:hypothetical protein
MSNLFPECTCPPLDETGGILKLYFTLSTGAVVLFTNLLVQSHVSSLVSAPLALSIFAFGGEAVLCLRILSALVQYRTIFGNALTFARVKSLQLILLSALWESS